MGQYYRAYLKRDNEEEVVYNRDLIINGKRQYTLAKLMEHSWWENEFVNAISKEIYQEPTHVMWVGDYVDEYSDNLEQIPNNLSIEFINKISLAAWDVPGIPINITNFYLNNKYLVNHTKKLYVDCNKYYENNKVKIEYANIIWCTHPLPLLTALGNGFGGGDYLFSTRDSTTELVGSWANDLISVEDEIPDDFNEINVIFREMYQ